MESQNGSRKVCDVNDLWIILCLSWKLQIFPRV
jgi:hypothetical protein